MIFVIEDDEIMAECIERACGRRAKVRKFADGILAMRAISEGEMPKLIFLDIMLNGPDGFTLMHELVSYADTAEIPIVIVTSLDMGGKDLSTYGVVGMLNKETMRPGEILGYVEKYDAE